MNDDPNLILAALERTEKLRHAAEQTALILERIEGARRQLSSGGDELLAVYREVKPRVSWLIAELDILRAELHHLL